MAKKVYIGVGQTENVVECPKCGSKNYRWSSDVSVECSYCGYRGSIDKFETVAIRNVARAVKNIYVGAAIDVPQYEESVQNVSITADNITDYFTVTNGAYYFAGSGGVFTSNNKYRGGSTASTVLTAKKSMTNVHFTYSWSSESRYDTFTLKVNGTTVENAVSGATTTKQYTGDLAEGQTIEFKYSKDSSQDGGSDICTFSNMSCDVMVRGVITKQNVARKVKKGYIGVNGVARVCFGGTPVSTLAVGSTVQIKENGIPVDYLVVHQGLPSDLYDESCDGTWLLRKDIAERRQWHSSDLNSYATSTIHAYLNGAWMDRYDAKIESAIKTVKIPYRPGAGYNTTGVSGASGLTVKTFLLSATEVSFTSNAIPYNDGTELSYFSGCAGSAADSKREAEWTEVNKNWWWLRTPYCIQTGGSNYAFYVETDGSGDRGYCTEDFGIRPAFILPNDFAIEDLIA